ncbi:MAG TPA: histidine kinase N-terminal 7TM domain-containing protein, partial [Polyangiaceae bacterium]|nr:histidine kinase N-terminal 7TM domain-containing protein [Polyangiaceae bacterium]
MNGFSLLSFLSFAICVYLGFFALRTDARSKTNRTFAGLCASLGIWAFCYTFIYPEHDDAVRWFWYRLSGIGWTSFAAFALHFFLTISETHRVTSRPWLVALLYVPAVAFLVRLWTGTLLVDSFLTGPMGTGKTFVAERLARHLVAGGDGFVELVQFHPAYAYEDFIQGIRPRTVGGKLDYVLEPGRFLEFCAKAGGRQGICVLIIDEINR